MNGAITDDEEFDLDITIVESSSTVGAFMPNTDDNCGQTDDSACVTCDGGEEDQKDDI